MSIFNDMCADAEDRGQMLSWSGDNRAFVCELVSNLKLAERDKQVMRWAYGCQDSTAKSYEQESDGETIVKDRFLNGVIKSPAGVTHDYINRVFQHTTPDGHKWSPWQANALYLRIMKALGYAPLVRWRRWFGVCVSSKCWWQ